MKNFEFLNYVVLQKQIDQLKNIRLQHYLTDFMTLKTILMKVIILIGVLILSAPLFFGMREYALNNMNNYYLNKGSGYGFGSTWPQAAVYAIKIIPTIILFVIFISANTWYICLLACFAWVNGLLNIIDKLIPDNGTEHAVVDYIYLINSVCNTADIFITISIPGVTIAIVGKFFYTEHLKEKAEKLISESENDKKQIE